MYYRQQLWERIEEQVAFKKHVNEIGREGKNMGQLKASKCEVWSGVKDLVSVHVSEQVHLGRISSQVRSSVKIGLRTGLMKSRGGKGAFIYKLLCEHHHIPMCSINNGDVSIADDYCDHTADRILAMHVISGGPKPSPNYSRSMYGSKLKHQQVQDVIAEEYSCFTESINAALMDIENNATLHYETTIKR